MGRGQPVDSKALPRPARYGGLALLVTSLHPCTIAPGAPRKNGTTNARKSLSYWYYLIYGACFFPFLVFFSAARGTRAPKRAAGICAAIGSSPGNPTIRKTASGMSLVLPRAQRYATEECFTSSHHLGPRHVVALTRRENEPTEHNEQGSTTHPNRWIHGGGDAPRITQHVLHCQPRLSGSTARSLFCSYPSLAPPRQRAHGSVVKKRLDAEAVRDVSPCRLAGSRDLAHLTFLLNQAKYDAGTQVRNDNDDNVKKRKTS